MTKYDYKWLPGNLVKGNEELLIQLSNLYSNHYGVRSANSPFLPGKRIQLSPLRLSDWLNDVDSKVALAYHQNELVGYAIAIQTKAPRYGVVSWVTQLVVHEEHRRSNVGKSLLFSIWRMSDHFAWGLLTANPYAVRALEKATRRRCDTKRIKKHKNLINNFGCNKIIYVNREAPCEIDKNKSTIFTNFFLDHSKLPDMLKNVSNDETPWLLGQLEEGWEWVAFTFKDQKQIGLSALEIENMLQASDQVTHEAYSRMDLGSGQGWMKFVDAEVEFIIQACGLKPGMSVLDIGCGNGRHSLALARAGMTVLGLDYLETLIAQAKTFADAGKLPNAQFKTVDCRDFTSGSLFDAVICLYDVVGTYIDEESNLGLLATIQKNLKSSGTAVLSVMNFELTKERAIHHFSMRLEPDRLQGLQPSRTMESTGNVFDPEFYMIDTETHIVYRREQFTAGDELPTELIVRDKRFTMEEISRLCNDSGLEVEHAAYVQAGRWDSPLTPTAKGAKEIRLICKKQ